MEAPNFLASRMVEGGDRSARLVLRTATANEDKALGDARRAGDSVVLLVGDDCLFPSHGAALGIERDQATIERRDIGIVAIERDAAIDRIAARPHDRFARNLWVEAPLELPGLGIECIDLAPGAGDIKRAVMDERRGFLPARGVEIEEPGKAQVAHVFRVDQFERREALFAIVAAIAEPIAVRSRCDHGIGNPFGHGIRAFRPAVAPCKRQGGSRRENVKAHILSSPPASVPSRSACRIAARAAFVNRSRGRSANNSGRARTAGCAAGLPETSLRRSRANSSCNAAKAC